MNAGAVRRDLPMVGAPHALPVVRLSKSQADAKHAPHTIAWWGQQKRWPAELVANLLREQPAGATLTEPEALALAEDAHALRHTVSWWGLKKKWPAWLVAAMAAQRHANTDLTEEEAHALAEQTAGLPLGRK